jgi:Transposase zinc-binding domain
MRCRHGPRGLAVLPAAPPSAVAYPLLGIAGVRGARLCRRHVSQRRRLPAARRRARGAVPRDRRALDAFLETTRRQADGVPLPAFVEQEFRDFLTCGILAHGFARLRCTECTLERPVPFSCKGRGFCPSCGGRRMTASAARLVDGVLPRVPVRQWVLSLPYRLRYLLAWDHGLARAVLAVSVRVLLGFQRHRARRYGIRAGRSGSVTVIPALRGRTESQRPFPHAVPRRRLLRGSGRGDRVPAPAAADR